MHSIALYWTLVLTEGERLRPSTQGWLIEPSAEQVHLFSVMEWVGLALISFVGIAWLVVQWRRLARSTRTIPLPPSHVSGSF